MKDWFFEASYSIKTYNSCTNRLKMYKDSSDRTPSFYGLA